jgi:preprotein translocase SecF subunit
VVSNEASGISRVYITTERLSDQERATVVSALTQKVGKFAEGQKESYANVSGVISAELVKNAILAVIFASVLILLYLAVRFAIGGVKEGLKYGACALVALAHDVLVLLGAFAIMGFIANWQVDSLFVTAVLTVIGFSVHDTIVVFDRIRENLQRRAKGESFTDLTDRSISQTLMRSINTSMTVIITLFALVALGGSSIRQFNSALLIGIISGTYSSIFNASVVLVLWKRNDFVVGQEAKSGLVLKSSAVLPGDKPLVNPPTPPASEEPSDALREAEESVKRNATRKQPVRRRRM